MTLFPASDRKRISGGFPSRFEMASDAFFRSSLESIAIARIRVLDKKDVFASSFSSPS